MRKGLPESSETCVNGSSESRKEATDRKMEVLSSKTKTRIGVWNVRTKYETGKLAQVTEEMQRYMLHNLGVSDRRWTGSGRQTMTTGETVLYSRREGNQHHEGVVRILRKGTEKSLLEWKPVSSRLMRARLRGRHTNITLIQCYTPTNDREDTTRTSSTNSSRQK